MDKAEYSCANGHFEQLIMEIKPLHKYYNLSTLKT